MYIVHKMQTKYFNSIYVPKNQMPENKTENPTIQCYYFEYKNPQFINDSLLFYENINQVKAQ